jgi:hypothetical protein
MAPAWADFATFRLELGVNVDWSGAGATWGVSKWGEGRWAGLYEPDEWRNVTRLVQSFDYDTGRQGLLDPGDVGTATVTLFDPAGDLGLAAGRSVGALLRAWAETSSGERLLFFGKVVESTYVADLAAPAITARAVDPLGIALDGDVLYALPPDTASTRLGRLLDDMLWPQYWRDIQDDGLPIVGVLQPGRRLDEARRGVESAGGTMWAEGTTIRYRDRHVALTPDVPVAFYLTTDQPSAGASPSQLGYAESITDVNNGILLESDSGRFRAEAVNASSVAHYGPRYYRRADLLTATQGDLDQLAARLLRLHAWPGERLDPLQVIVHDDRSAAAVLVTLGDLVDVHYTGSAPAHHRQIVGGVAHHVTPDEWAVVLRTFDADPSQYEPEPTSLHWAQPPTDWPPGAGFAPSMRVWVLDQRGYLVADPVFRVLISVAEGGGFLVGDYDVNTVGGVALFPTVALIGAPVGPGHVIRAIALSPALPDLALIAESPPFTVLGL